MPEKIKVGEAKLKRANEILGIIFYAIWILVGLFFLLFIYGNIKQGALTGLFRPSKVQNEQAQPPTETTIPGVGKINIGCVQEALSTEAIQKILTSGNTSNLTDEERAKLEPCILEKEATPSPSSEK